MILANPPALGSRVLIRDEEWLVQRADPCEGALEGRGGWQLACVGLSETVRNHQALFLTPLEDITVLDPANTELVPDTSAAYIHSRLLIEARLHQSAIQQTGALVMGHQAVMDVMRFQLKPALQALEQLRPRLLIADTVGLGKTLEAGILTAELVRRGRARRILVVTTKSMMKQFQHEFWNRFTIPLIRLDSAGIQRIHRQIPSSHNPFNHFDRTIISVDTLKRDQQYRQFLEKAWWDLIIIDEAHNVSFKGSRTQSNRLARLLAQRSDALILLSATPHNGKKESLASLINMLDPTVLPPRADYTRQQIEHLFIRRFKNQVADEMKKAFPERKGYKLIVQASPEEEEAFRVLAQLKGDEKQQASRKPGRDDGAALLFSTLLEKSLFSSPAACLQTLKERISRLRKKDAAHADLPELQALQQAVQAIQPTQFSKFQYLLQLLQGKLTSHAATQPAPGTDQAEATITPKASPPANPDAIQLEAAHAPNAAYGLHYPLQDWHWDGTKANDRLVIFTERIETLRFLQNHLPAALGLKKDAVAVLEGQMNDAEIQKVVEDFGRQQSPLRLLIASDVASEGLNLHHQAHRLIHFDIPWSLMVFQQRNGRVDRYGQTQRPMIGYLYTQPTNQPIRGDVRYLEILIQKDDQVSRNTGDASAFTGFVNEEEEVQYVGASLEQGKDPEQALAYDQPPSGREDAVSGGAQVSPDDAFASLFGSQNDLGSPGAASTGASLPASGDSVWSFFDSLAENGVAPASGDTSINVFPGTPVAAPEITQELPSLFKSHYHYLKQALQYLQQGEIPCTTTAQDRKQGADTEANTLEVKPGADLQQVLSRQLGDLYPETGTFTLSASKETVSKSIQDACNNDGIPKIQYLWPVHPVLHWLDYRLMGLGGRQKAPVLRVQQGLRQDEAMFLILAQRPNRRGQTMQSSWLGVQIDQAGKQVQVLDGFDKVQDKVGLAPDQASQLTNDGDAQAMASRLACWQPYVRVAIQEAQNYLQAVNQHRDEACHNQLQQELERLQKLKQQYEQQIALQFGEASAQPRQLRQRQHEESHREANALFDQYTQWATDTLKLDRQSQLTLVAVLIA